MNKDTFSTPSRRMPAEWEPQSGIQLTWPHEATDWQSCLQEITHTFVELAETIAHYEPVLIATPHPQEVEKLLHSPNISIVGCNSNDTWARDHAALTLFDEANRPILLDFQFNGWGNKFNSQFDNQITRNLHALGCLQGTLENHNDFVLEGGSVESDGQGTLLTSSQCLLAPHRNQPLNKQEIEIQLKRRLHAHTVLWVDHGNLLGDDTDGHIDTIVRMAPDNTLLYMGCTDATDEQFADLQALKQQVLALRNAQCEPFNCIELPSPAAIYDEQGERLPATYANYLVINGAVIVPTYAQPHTDKQAMELIGQAFPNRHIVGIDARVIIKQHGSIHCLTMQYPTGVIKA